MNSVNVFEYNDYRKYLGDFFDRMRKLKAAFSLRYFAQRAGFPSHSFFSAVVKGKRNLTRQATEKMATGLGLSGKQADFFRLLVAYNQAASDAERDSLFLEMNTLRKFSSYYRLNKKHFDYFSHWFCFPLRELVVSSNWGDDYGRLGRMLEPQISAADARKGVKILLKAGLVNRQDDGSYTLADSIITTQDIPGHLVRKVRAELIDLSRRASEKMHPSIRDLGSATVALSASSFSKAAEILDEARRKVLALADSESTPERVYQVHLHMFPLSGAFTGDPQQGEHDA